MAQLGRSPRISSRAETQHLNAKVTHNLRHVVSSVTHRLRTVHEMRDTQCHTCTLNDFVVKSWHVGKNFEHLQIFATTWDALVLTASPSIPRALPRLIPALARQIAWHGVNCLSCEACLSDFFTSWYERSMKRTVYGTNSLWYGKSTVRKVIRYEDIRYGKSRHKNNIRVVPKIWLGCASD